jgi:spore coat polysaccharide biosynthesis protein SpsF
MLERQVERIRRAKACGELLLATSTHASDQAIVDLCSAIGLDCFRGSLDDVLDRFYQAALARKPEYVIRLTGDNPLNDPILIDKVVDFHLAGGFDYSSNSLTPTFPNGLDVEIFHFKLLEQAWHEANLPSQREHVTPFFYQHPRRFKVGEFLGTVDNSALRWTVDEPLDLQLVRTIYEALYPINPEFSTEDILEYLETKPELKSLNICHDRNEGYNLSLAKDAAWELLNTREQEARR